MRLQPKASTFRPITHFKAKISVNENLNLSGNNLLVPMQHMLRSAFDDSNICVTSYNELIQKIEAFAE